VSALQLVILNEHGHNEWTLIPEKNADMVPREDVIMDIPGGTFKKRGFAIDTKQKIPKVRGFSESLVRACGKVVQIDQQIL
jgi:hypothetical protein